VDHAHLLPRPRREPRLRRERCGERSRWRSARSRATSCPSCCSTRAANPARSRELRCWHEALGSRAFGAEPDENGRGPLRGLPGGSYRSKSVDGGAGATSAAWGSSKTPSGPERFPPADPCGSPGIGPAIQCRPFVEPASGRLRSRRRTRAGRSVPDAAAKRLPLVHSEENGDRSELPRAGEIRKDNRARALDSSPAGIVSHPGALDRSFRGRRADPRVQRLPRGSAGRWLSRFLQDV
jgi:hypothetical protein